LSHAAGDVTEERVLAEAGDGNNWFLKGGNYRGEHFSPLTSINDKTVTDLGLKWASNLSVLDGISATPIVVDGVIYLSGAYSLVFAVDAASGDIIWQYDPDVRSRFGQDPRMSWTARVNRGVAVWQGKVLTTTADCRLIALDAKTGEKIWSKQTCDWALGYRITDSPYVGGDTVFPAIGLSATGSPIRPTSVAIRYSSVTPAQNRTKRTAAISRLMTSMRQARRKYIGGNENGGQDLVGTSAREIRRGWQQLE
jgi:outer membrane protein assembly factor BamB